MGTSVVVLPVEFRSWVWYWFWFPGYLTWPPAGLFGENGGGIGCLPSLGPGGMDVMPPVGPGPRFGLPCWMDDALKGVSLRGGLIVDGGLSSSRISNSSSGRPGTLSYWEAFEPRSVPGTKPLERGLLWAKRLSSGLEGAGDAPRLSMTSRAAAALTSSIFVTEGLTQRGVKLL